MFNKVGPVEFQGGFEIAKLDITVVKALDVRFRDLDGDNFGKRDDQRAEVSFELKTVIEFTHRLTSGFAFLFVLALLARLAATSLELMVVPAPAIRILALGVVAACAAGIGVWALLRHRRHPDNHAPGA